MSDEGMSDTIPEDPGAIANWVKSRVSESRSKGFRASFEAQWLRNIAYQKGYSGVVFDSTLRQFRNSDGKNSGSRRNRLHINKMLPTLQNRLARLVKQKPKYMVLPNSNDSDNKEASRLAEQVLDCIYDKQKVAYKYIELIDWAQVVGHCYFKVSIDPDAGEMITDPMTGEASNEGEIRVDVVSGFECFPDPLAKDMDELNEFVHAKVRKLSYFKTRYPGIGDQVKAEDTFLLSLQYESRINNMNSNSQGFMGGSPQVNEKNTAVEMVYYQKKSKKYPQGRMLVVANGVLLEDKELPVGEIPFIKFDDVLAPGKFYSEAIATHLIPVQDQYNQVITKRAKWTNLLLAGKYLVPRGSGLTQESMNDQSGEVIEYDPIPNGAPPMAMQIPVIPSYAYNEEASLERMFNDIAGINEVSRGQTLTSPNAPTAAMALQFMQQQDETRIGVQCRRNELGLAQFFKLVLMYVGKYYQTPRLLKIAGNNNSYQVKEFTGADLMDNYDVKVIEGSSVPTSPYAKKEEVLTYYKAGLLGDPSDPKVREKTVKMLEFGDVAETWQDQGLDANQFRRIKDSIKQGTPTEINEFDNHMYICEELNRFRKSDEYSELAPESQQLLMETMHAHMDAMINAQMPPPPGVNAPPIQMPEGMAPGGGGAPGGMPPLPGNPNEQQQTPPPPGAEGV